MRSWQLQEAKNKLSEVVQRAGTEGPQAITVRGEERAVVISMEEYRNLKKPAPRLIDVLRDPRFAGSELEIPPRDPRERLIDFPPADDD